MNASLKPYALLRTGAFGNLPTQLLSALTAVTVAVGMSTTFVAPAQADSQNKLDYTLFDTYPLMGGYYYSSAESTGPSWVLNMQGKLPVRPEPAYTPGSALELTYISRPSGTWQAKLMRRKSRGQDEWDNGVFVQKRATPFKAPEVLHMRVHAKNVPGAALPQVSLLMRGKPITSAVSLAPFLKQASDDGWALAEIPISQFGGPTLQSAEQVEGIQLSQSDADQREHKMFLDEIDIRPATTIGLATKSAPSLLSTKGFERHIDLSWAPTKDEAVEGVVIERSSDGTHFKPVGFRPKWMSRYADYVGPEAGERQYRVKYLGYDGTCSDYSTTKSAATRQMTEAELLDMVQEACARYYWDGAEENSGMTLESIPGDAHMVACGASGFGIMSLVVAGQRGFVPRDQLDDRMLKILSFLNRTDRFHGVLPHYINGSTAHPQLFFGPDDNGGDLVETSFLMQGLLTARQYFDRAEPKEQQIRDQITTLWKAVEWDWYRKTPDGPYLVWHWSPDKGWKIYHRLIGWNETMITYLLGIASPTHGVPPEMYYSGWASQEKLAEEYRGNDAGKMYTNGGVYYGKKLDVGGFSGSPIFFTHYNFMAMNPHGLRDRYTDYFDNSKAICEINLRYCMENPGHHTGYGDTAWGLTASDGPSEYSADEPRPERDKGKITPTGAIASMPYLPAESMAALKNYYRNYGSFLWGEYGFRDAFSLDNNWVNDLYMGLNQGPMVVMIENFRTGTPWNLFGSNPEIKAMRDKVFITPDSKQAKADASQSNNGN